MPDRISWRDASDSRHWRMVRIPRLVRFLGVGLMIGIWFSAFVHAMESADPSGEIPGEHIHGISVVMLGFFSLPWSIPLWFSGITLSGLFGEVPVCPPWLYWSMPPVAGMGWAWLLSVILANVRLPRRQETPQSVVHPVGSDE